MATSDWAAIAVSIVWVAALVGFFRTKKEGFGRFTTSTLLLLLVAGSAAVLCASGRLEVQTLVNIFFAIIGFASGLFTKGDKDEG